MIECIIRCNIQTKMSILIKFTFYDSECDAQQQKQKGTCVYIHRACMRVNFVRCCY